MIGALLALIVLVTTGCSTASGPPPAAPSLRDLAGTWHGRLAGPLANAATSLTIKDDGAYAGTMHFEAGDRPFTGAIVLMPRGRLRYHGTFGDGGVQATPPHGPASTLRFVPDGGGGAGSFTRVR